jgi:hypothetical protein
MIPNSNESISSQTLSPIVREEWADPEYGRSFNHAIFNKVIIDCTDNDNNCVNNIISRRGIQGIHLYATPLKTGAVCCMQAEDYNMENVQSCLKNPNLANCNCGRFTDISYPSLPTGESSVIAKRTLPTDPADLDESFIIVVLSYNRTTLSGRVIYQTCTPDSCQGTNDGF